MLLDHFHPPISQRRSWEGFHGLWAAALVEKLNRDVLGEEHFADMQVHVGSQVEVDVATLEEHLPGRVEGGTATAALARIWTPPATDLILPTVFPDEIEVRILATTTGPALVGAIELVSPGNKDRAEARRAFAAKCVAYLSQGIGLIVVDIVTSRLANMHNEIVGLLGREQPFTLDPPVTTYAVAYRPSRRATGDGRSDRDLASAAPRRRPPANSAARAAQRGNGARRPRRNVQRCLHEEPARMIRLLDYVLRLFAAKKAARPRPRNGAELVAYWESERLIGTRPDIVDAASHARALRERAQHREHSG